MDAAVWSWITATVIDQLAAGRTPPAAASFLLRRYLLDGDPSLRDAVELSLAHGVDAAALAHDPRERCQWLGVLADASAISDDERLPTTVQRELPDAIDGLEQWIRSTYEPGEGILGAAIGEQARAAAALLTAFELTGRLPYSMLAEEILQLARRHRWDDARGCFDAAARDNAVAASVCCRLAALHRDAEYRAHAVVATGADYAHDGELVLASLAPHYRDHADAAADYGVALLDQSILSRINPP